jgi:hypothetical protein
MDHVIETWAYCCFCRATTQQLRLKGKETQCEQCGAVHDVYQLPKDRETKEVPRKTIIDKNN